LVAVGITAPTALLGVARVGLATMRVAVGVASSAVGVANASVAVGVTVGKETASAVGVAAARATVVGVGDDAGERKRKVSAPAKTSRLAISAAIGNSR